MHYHFIGIGGVGMGPLALLMLKKGCTVSGSDLKAGAWTDKLRQAGAQIHLGHDRLNVGQADHVVYSSAIPADNPEFQEALKRGIPLLKRAQLLAAFVNEKKGITIAGAHGKTTTSCMIAHILLNEGLRPTTAIGGLIHKSTEQAYLGEGPYVVAETDESDGSFLYFHPYYAVITNIDFEHVDYYHTWENILKAYRQFMEQTKSDGHLLINGDDVRLRALAQQTGRKFLSFGLTKENDLYADQIRWDGFSVHFHCRYQRKALGWVTLRNLPGEHNVRNALGSIGLGLMVEIPFDRMGQHLKCYPGVKRRFEAKGYIRDILIIDDYGHHPAEILTTLKTAQILRPRRVITIFQPHRYSRTQYLLNELAQSLTLSDCLIVTDIYAANEIPIPGVTAEHLVERILKFKRMRVTYLKKEAILPHLKEMVQSGDLVLTLGAGDIYRIGEKLVEELTLEEILQTTH